MVRSKTSDLFREKRNTMPNSMSSNELNLTTKIPNSFKRNLIPELEGQK